jgi:hypothetical protein
MPIHPIPQHLHRRQPIPGDPLSVPSGIAGVTGGAVTVSSQAATATGFLFDSTISGASVTAPASAPPLAQTIVVTSSSSSTPVPSTASSSSASSNSTIPMSTVIAVCVGTFVALTALVLVGWCLYKRSLRELRKTRTPLRAGHGHNQREQERSRVRSQAWNKLEDVDVVQTKEVDLLGPMEKLTMFKNSISLTPESGQFATYQPSLAPEVDEPRRRPLLGRSYSGRPASWGDEEMTVRADSGISKGAMSPPISRAIPTPPAITSGGSHRWESAVVMHFDEESGVVEEEKKSKNPFVVDKKGKGKERAVEMNPFGDEYGTKMPSPIAHHVANMSTSSTTSSERAMQSLIAVLDVTPEEVEERLRAASIVSNIEDNFPTPPLVP